MVPDAMQEAICKKIRPRTSAFSSMGYPSTGMIGTQWRGLTQFDRPDMAYTIASNRDYPSWGYMAEQGCYHHLELWNGKYRSISGNHVMLLGDLLIWYYENLANCKLEKKKKNWNPEHSFIWLDCLAGHESNHSY